MSLCTHHSLMGWDPDDLCILQVRNEGQAAASRGWQPELGRARGRVPGL